MSFSRRLVGLGLSYYTASVELRERARCTLEDIDQTRCSDPRFSAVSEIALVSTCNRLELYAAVTADAGSVESASEPAAQQSLDRDLLIALLAATCHLDIEQLAGCVYTYHGLDAHDHLARVAAGLESMVLGEPQILGQVTSAYEEAVARHTVGPILSAAMRSAIRCGKRAHNETRISRKPASISSVAVAMAASKLERLAECRVVVIGVGEMGLQTLKALQARRVARVTVVNRTVSKAARVAEPFGYAAAGLDELPDLLPDADLVVSATGADGLVLPGEMVQAASATRAERPLLLIDVALPRDVDPAVQTLRGIELIDIDQLNASYDDARAARMREVPKVEGVIADESVRFSAALQQLTVEPVIADLRRKAEEIRQREVERTLRFIGDDADPETVKHIQHMTRALVNKLLHDPTVLLKQKAIKGDGSAYAETVQELFALSSAVETQP